MVFYLYAARYSLQFRHKFAFFFDTSLGQNHDDLAIKLNNIFSENMSLELFKILWNASDLKTSPSL